MCRVVFGWLEKMLRVAMEVEHTPIKFVSVNRPN